MLHIAGITALILGVLTAPSAVAAPVVSAGSGPADSAAQPSWSSKGQAFSVQLMGLNSDNVQALYESMGYPPAAIRMIKGFCVFGTAIHNHGTAPVTYNVADWRAVTADGVRHKLRTKTRWLQLWAPLGVSSDWSILPPQQSLQASDWGQGFTTIDLPRNTHFDLVYSWTEHARLHQATIRGVQCAAD